MFHQLGAMHRLLSASRLLLITYNQGCPQDVKSQDRDETETIVKTKIAKTKRQD